MTEEPYLGWIRIEREGEKAFYKSPFPRTVIRSAAMLRQFLTKEKAAGRMLDVEVDKFSFKRRHGLKKKAGDVHAQVTASLAAENGDSSSQDKDNDVTDESCEDKTVVDLLTRDPSKILDHKKLLSHTAKQVDKSRPIILNHDQNSFNQLKERLAEASDMKDIVNVLTNDEQGIEALRASFSDICLAEICQMDIQRGPLVDFPPSVNENVYSKIVEYGLKSCPHLVSLAINLVVKKEDPVLPSHVLKIATLFSNMCYSTNNNMDALVKLRSLTQQMDGLTNKGLDVLSDCGLAHCARSLSNHRDLFAEIGRSVIDNTAKNFPYQSILDNCDLMQEHLTVEVVEKETVDTSHLSSIRKSKEEALALFRKEEVLLGAEENNVEREHFLYVVGVVVGKILALKRPEAQNLKKYLPAHHKHQNSEVKLTPAITFIIKPYPYQETKGSFKSIDSSVTNDEVTTLLF